jgi:DNA-binding transcriptional MerR regulator
LEIRDYTDQGFSLERIGELLSRDSEAPPAASAPRAGSITVQSHIHLADGVELVVEPGQARLTPEQLRRFARAAIEAYARIAGDEQD